MQISSGEHISNCISHSGTVPWSTKVTWCARVFSQEQQLNTKAYISIPPIKALSDYLVFQLVTDNNYNLVGLK